MSPFFLGEASLYMEKSPVIPRTNCKETRFNSSELPATHHPVLISSVATYEVQIAKTKCSTILNGDHLSLLYRKGLQGTFTRRENSKTRVIAN
jgi:hypothetical protein